MNKCGDMCVGQAHDPRGGGAVHPQAGNGGEGVNKCGDQAHRPSGEFQPRQTSADSHVMLLCGPCLLTVPPLFPSSIVQITSTNVDIARVSPAYHLYTQAEVEEVMARI